MAGDCLLDTNIVIAILNGDEAAVTQLSAVRVFLSSVVVGELYFGAFASAQSEKNLANLERFVGLVSVLSVSHVTAKWYGAVKGKLRAMGRPIPDNDIWVAATALEHGLTLATRDDHFKYVDGLAITRW